jgi:hypothetical protein
VTLPESIPDQPGTVVGKSAICQEERMTEYAYPHFQAKLLLEDRAFLGGVEPGGRFPDFDLPTVDGGRARSQELVGQRPLFMYFGSVT